MRKTALAALALLAGCALLPQAAPPAPFAALPPASYGGSARAEQVLTLSRVGGTRTLQGYVEVSPERITMVGATALGQRVLSLSYDADGPHIAPGVPRGVAEQALRDLQLVHWPLAALQAAVAGTRWRIEEPRPGTRQVWHGEEAWAEVHYAGATPWDGRAWLVNFAEHYTLAIESKVVR